MLAMVLRDGNDVRRARECGRALARAAGVPDPEMVEVAVGEIGINCLEHADGEGAVVLRMSCGRGRLSLRAENPCRHRPTWQTRKPEALEGFRVGGYGLVLVRALAQQLSTTWRQGRAVVRAEFR
jgi:anti-sigma regulatory factor (Ser/Thr protein kinase)